MSYGDGLEIEWTLWELAKIAEIKDRRNRVPLVEKDWSRLRRCSWPDCQRQAAKGTRTCRKHGRLLRAVGPIFRDY